MQSQDSSLTGHDRWLIFLILLVVIITPFASDSYTPSLPAMTTALGSTADQMQLTMTYYLFGASISQLIYGPLSDRFGRKPVILLGLFIAIIGSVLCASASTLQFILISRLIQGGGAGVTNALFRAVMRDSFSGAKMSQVASFAGMFYMFVYASAPIIGGYIQEYLGWRENFIFTAILGAAILTVLFVYLHETHAKPDSTATKFKNIIRNYFSILSSMHFVGYTALSSLAFSGVVAYYTAAPFIMQNVIGLSAVQFGWVSIGITAGIAIGQYINAKLVTKVGVLRMLLIGLLLMTFSGTTMLMFGMLHVINTTVVIVPILVYGIAAGMVYTNAMANAMHEFAHIAGSAGAMYGSLQILGSSITSYIVSILPETSQLPLALVLTGLGVIALVIYAGLQRLPKVN